MAVAKEQMHSLAGDGLGHTVVNSTPGARQDTIPLVVSNFVNPINLLPEPYGDGYLYQMDVIAAGEDEAVVTTVLLPGHLEYLRNEGIVSDRTQVIEIPTRGEIRNGFPHGDALEQLVRLIDDKHAVLRDSDSGRTYTLIPTLTNSGVEEQARRLGMQTLGQPDSDITNNKALLRQAEHRYGLHMLPGDLITQEINLDVLAQKYGGLQHGVWVKFPTGSGGDLVVHVEQVTQESIREAIAKVRETIWEAYEEGEFGVSGKEFWSEDQVAPTDFPLVIETDARNLGEIVLLGSNHFSTSPEGVEMYGYFRQITGEDGSFIGSERFYPNLELKAKIDARTRRVAQFAIDQGYYATAGEDYIVVRRPEGTLEVFDLELNARPIISEFPDIIGQRTGIPNWKNVNITLPAPISNMAEFAHLVGEDLYLLGQESGVIPMAFRTVVASGNGITHCKVFIGGNDENQKTIIARLQEKGVKIGQTV